MAKEIDLLDMKGIYADNALIIENISLLDFTKANVMNVQQSY